MEREIDRAGRRIPRADTLRDKQPVNNNRIPFVVTFHPALSNIGEILDRLHPVLKSSRRCNLAIEQVPMVAFRRPKSLKDILAHSEMVTSDNDKGCCRWIQAPPFISPSKDSYKLQFTICNMNMVTLENKRAIICHLLFCLECLAPLGMENFKITPAQISASSQFDGDLAPSHGRLHYKGIGGAWAAKVNDLHQWFQIDSGIDTTVSHVATQGRHNIMQWVTQYKLQYSSDGNSFQVFKQQGENADKVDISLLQYENKSINTNGYLFLACTIQTRYIEKIQ